MSKAKPTLTAEEVESILTAAKVSGIITTGLNLKLDPMVQILVKRAAKWLTSNRSDLPLISSRDRRALYPAAYAVTGQMLSKLVDEIRSAREVEKLQRLSAKTITDIIISSLGRNSREMYRTLWREVRAAHALAKERGVTPEEIGKTREMRDEVLRRCFTPSGYKKSTVRSDRTSIATLTYCHQRIFASPTVIRLALKGVPQSKRKEAERNFHSFFRMELERAKSHFWTEKLIKLQEDIKRIWGSPQEQER